MKDLLQVFKQVIEDSPKSKTEFAWDMKIDPLRLKTILEKGAYTEAEELSMHRIIFHEKYKIEAEDLHSGNGQMKIGNAHTS